MQYRKLPRGTGQVSVLGIGTSSIQASSEKEIEKMITAAMENGINYFDMASSEAKPFAAYGRAIKGMHRGNVFIAIIVSLVLWGWRWG